MIVPRTSRHSVIATCAGGLAFNASVRNHTVFTDQPIRAGGMDSAPTPLELLSASLATCIALHIRQFCEENSLSADGLAVEVKPIWRDPPGHIARFDVIVHVPDSFPAAYGARIEEVVRLCPVYQTLIHAPEITVQCQEAVAVFQ
jgi:uncharacterized OsmC-like protein